MVEGLLDYWRVSNKFAHGNIVSEPVVQFGVAYQCPPEHVTVFTAGTQPSAGFPVYMQA